MTILHLCHTSANINFLSGRNCKISRGKRVRLANFILSSDSFAYSYANTKQTWNRTTLRLNVTTKQLDTSAHTTSLHADSAVVCQTHTWWRCWHVFRSTHLLCRRPWPNCGTSVSTTSRLCSGDGPNFYHRLKHKILPRLICLRSSTSTTACHHWAVFGPTFPPDHLESAHVHQTLSLS